jgi:hypothetical protein
VSQGNQGVFCEALERAEAIADYLWGIADKRCGFQTPDQQASFKALYKRWIQSIIHPDLKRLYAQTFDARFNQRLFEMRRQRLDVKHRPPPQRNALQIQARLLLFIVLSFPQIIEAHYDSLTRLVLPQGLQILLEKVLNWFESQEQSEAKEESTILNFLEKEGMRKQGDELLNDMTLKLHVRPLLQSSNPERVCSFFQDILSCFQRATNLKRDIVLAESTFARQMHEKAWTHLQKVRELYLSS